MNGNECVVSPRAETLKHNGGSLLDSPPESISDSHTRECGTTLTPSDHFSTPDRSVLSRIPEGEEDHSESKSHCKSKYHACPSSGTLKYLHHTPPSRSKSIVVTNPFDVGITERLHLPMYSPSVFARVVSPSQDSTTFRWTIEEISRIYPADIEEFPVHQYDEVVDPELETKAQEAINRFFGKNQQLLPSPWNPRPDSSVMRQEVNHGTPLHLPATASSHPDSDSELDTSASSSKGAGKEVWTQTTLTLPPVLPPSMELALKPFFTFTQDQRQAQVVSQSDSSSECEEGALSTSTLRRKLFFHSDSSPSPAPATPIQSFLPGITTPVGFTHSLVQFQGRSFGTPLPGANTMQSPPGISPVQTGSTPMRRVKSATRLDFSQEDMSVDTSLCAAPSTPRQAPPPSQAGACSPLGTAPLHDKDRDEEHSDHSLQGLKWIKRNKRNSLDCSSDSMRISQTSTPVKSNHSMDLSSAQNMMDLSESKPSSQTDAWQESDVAYQHDGPSFLYSHQATSSNMLSHDTGYGTRSSCDPGTFQSGTSMFGLSLTREKMGYEDSLATWPINPNVISSTPTKSLGMRVPEYQQDV